MDQVFGAFLETRSQARVHFDFLVRDHGQRLVGNVLVDQVGLGVLQFLWVPQWSQVQAREAQRFIGEIKEIQVQTT